MPTLQQQIAEKFVLKLRENPAIDDAKIDQLESLLATNKRPKAEELVRIFSTPVGGDLK